MKGLESPIQKIEIVNYDDRDSLVITLQNGKEICLADDNQQCLEDRHMTCDDDLEQFIGAHFIDYEELECKDISADSSMGADVHDIMFLKINTTKGSFRITSHNIHNGCYEGFKIQFTITSKRKMVN